MLKRLPEYEVLSAQAHGHLCAGQILGLRMALYGVRLLDLEDPTGVDRKRLATIGPEDLPGYKAPRVVCAECGESVNFKRELLRGGRLLCRAGAGERYYQPL
jgi:formylmethanofuran dehydrogenase subunit E